jgi:hypothetical protein
MAQTREVVAMFVPRTLVYAYGGRVHYSVLKDHGMEEVYKEVFDELRTSTPSGISFPDDKFFFATPLFDFGNELVASFRHRRTLAY